MTKINVQITEDDIILGERGSPDGCPVALAVARLCRSIVGGMRFEIPEYVVAIIKKYDEHGDMDPFEFEVTEWETFPELGKRRRTVKIYERSYGFVCEVRLPAAR